MEYYARIYVVYYVKYFLMAMNNYCIHICSSLTAYMQRAIVYMPSFARQQSSEQVSVVRHSVFRRITSQNAIVCYNQRLSTSAINLIPQLTTGKRVKVTAVHRSRYFTYDICIIHFQQKLRRQKIVIINYCFIIYIIFLSRIQHNLKLTYIGIISGFLYPVISQHATCVLQCHFSSGV